MIIIKIYEVLVTRRHGGDPYAVWTFSGKPAEVLSGGRRPHKIVGYRGVSVYGEAIHREFLYLGDTATVREVGQANPPKYQLGEQLLVVNTVSVVPREIVSVRFDPSRGWRYLTHDAASVAARPWKPPSYERWLSERELGQPSRVKLLPG